MDDDGNLYMIMRDAVTQQRNIYVIPTGTGITGSGYIQRTILLPSDISGPAGLAISGNDLYIADATNGRIYVIDADTPDNTQAIIQRTILLPTESNAPVGLTIDTSGNLYIVHSVPSSTDDVIHVIDADTADNTQATINRTILLPNQIAQPHGLVISGNNLYIADTTNTGIYVIDADTADNTEAVISKTILINNIATNVLITAIAIDGSDNLYLGNLEDDNVYVIPTSTANNTEAVVSRTLFLSRHNLNSPLGVSVDTNQNFYILNRRDGRNFEVYVLNADTRPDETAYIRKFFKLNVSDIVSATISDLDIDTGGNLYVYNNRLLSDNSVTRHARVYDANTTDGATANTSRIFRISSGVHVPSVSVDNSDNLYLLTTDNFGDTVSVLDANSANGTTITPRIFKLADFENRPNGINADRFAVQVDGNNLYLLGRDLVRGITQLTYKFYAVPADTADGVQAMSAHTVVVPSRIVDPMDIEFQDGLRPPLITTDTADIRGGNSVDFDIVFPESVTDFVLSDIMIDGGTGTALTGSGTDYVLAVTTDPGAGEVEITIPDDVVTPGNFKSTATFARAAHATVEIRLPRDAPTGETAIAIVEFSENVTGLTTSDFSVDVGSITGLSGGGSVYRLTMTTPATGNGIMTLTLASNAVDQGNLKTQARLFYFDGIRHGLYVLQEPTTTTELKGIHVVPDYIAQGETLSDADISNFNFLPALDNLSGMGIDASGNLFVAMRASDLPDPANSFTDDVIATVPTDASATGRGYVQEIVRLLDSFTVPPDPNTYRLGTPRGVGVSGNNVWIVDSTDDLLYQVRGVGAGSVASLPSAIGSPSGLAMSGSDFYIADDQDRRIYVCRISGNTATINRTILLPSAIGDPNGLAIDGNDLYVADDSGDEVYVIPANTANNTTASITKTINLPNTISSPSALALSGNNLWIGDSTDNAVYRVNANTPNNQTATIQETLNLAIHIDAPEAITLDANGLLYVADQTVVPGDTRRGIYVMPADVQDGRFGFIQRTIYLPTTISEPRGLTIGGTDFYLVDETDDAIYQLTLPAGDKMEATIAKTINLPSDISDPQALAFYDDKLYIADDSDNNIYQIDANTPNNQTAAIEKTILLRGGGISNIKGLAIDGKLLHFSSYRNLLGDDDIQINTILTDTADNTEAEFIQTLTLPQTIDRPFAMAFQPVPQITTPLDVEVTTPYPTRYVIDIGMDDRIPEVSGILSVTGQPDDPPDLNDYPIYFIWNQAAPGFDEDDIILFNATLQSFEKLSDRLYKAVIRPPETGTGAVIVRIRLNAIPTGSNQKTLFLNYTDRVARTLLFNIQTAIPDIQIPTMQDLVPIHVEASRVYALATTGRGVATPTIFAMDHSGKRLMSEDVTADFTTAATDLDFLHQVNGKWYAKHQNRTGNIYQSVLNGDTWQPIAYVGDLGFEAGNTPNFPSSVALNRWGMFFPPRDGEELLASDFDIMAQPIEDGMPPNLGLVGSNNTKEIVFDGARALGDRVYWQTYDTDRAFDFFPVRVTRAVDDTEGAEIVTERLAPLEQTLTNNHIRMAVYGNYMYFFSTDRNIYRFDLRPYRKPEVRTHILPQFITEGESLDLTHCL